MLFPFRFSLGLLFSFPELMFSFQALIKKWFDKESHKPFGEWVLSMQDTPYPQLIPTNWSSRQRWKMKIYSTSLHIEGFVHFNGMRRVKHLLFEEACVERLTEDLFLSVSKGRIPVLSFYHSNGASLTRCSQPMVGLSRTTCVSDEDILRAIRDANPSSTTSDPTNSSDTLYIYDARPRLNAIGNQASGAGTRCEYNDHPFTFLSFL